MTDWKSALRADPIPWLLETACAPIRYRVLTELLDRGRDDLEVQKIRQEALAYPEALRLQRTQRKDGTWGGAIHAGDPRRYQPSAENGLCRLYEFGWNRETKAVRNAAKPLRSLPSSKHSASAGKRTTRSLNTSPSRAEGPFNSTVASATPARRRGTPKNSTLTTMYRKM